MINLEFCYNESLGLACLKTSSRGKLQVANLINESLKVTVEETDVYLAFLIETSSSNCLHFFYLCNGQMTFHTSLKKRQYQQIQFIKNPGTG